MGYFFNSLDMGPILIKKSLEGVPFHKKLRKNGKISCFEAENPIEMGLDLRKLSNQPFFKWRKILMDRDMGRGFGPQAAHSVKNEDHPPPGKNNNDLLKAMQSILLVNCEPTSTRQNMSK